MMCYYLNVQFQGQRVNFEKACDSINREALWLKLRKIGVSENMFNCIKIMYPDKKFCMKPDI